LIVPTYAPSVQEWIRLAALAINLSVRRGERFYGQQDSAYIVDGGTFWNVVYNNASALQVNSTQVMVNGVKLLATGKVQFTGLGNYASDAAAATGGVAVGGLYHNAGAVRVRLT
jgi:hypothetical protein